MAKLCQNLKEVLAVPGDVGQESKESELQNLGMEKIVGFSTFLVAEKKTSSLGEDGPKFSSWWFQPIWKILVKLDHLLI